MTGPSLKYAVVERERRWLLPGPPALVAGSTPVEVTDRYLDGTRLRLREMVGEDGSVVRKLNHKVRLGDGADQVACTSVYLDEAEWSLLSVLPGRVLRKRRWRLQVEGQLVAVDAFAGPLAGLVLVEVDRRDGPDPGLPGGFDPVAEVTSDEAFTGAILAELSRVDLVAVLVTYGFTLPPAG